MIFCGVGFLLRGRDDSSKPRLNTKCRPVWMARPISPGSAYFAACRDQPTPTDEGEVIERRPECMFKR